MPKRYNLIKKLTTKMIPNQYRRILAIVAILGFWGLIWPKVLWSTPGGWFSACPNCWGDWSAHLTYTSAFAYAFHWPPELPVFSGHKFTYPFVIDLVSAGLVKLGLTLPQSLVIPGLVLSVVLTWFIYRLAKELTGSSLAAVFSVLIFFFNGAWNKDSRWLNFITAQLIPQRGQLPGLIISVGVYWLLWKKRPALAGILAGLLPLIHTHSYLVTLAVGFWSGWRFLLPALALGLPQIAYFYGLASGSHFLALNLFWLKEWLKLWPLVLIMLLGLIASPKKLRKFSLPFWLVFLAANFFRLQPYDWDNTKLFIHWYLIAAITLGLALSRRPLIGLVIVAWLIFPGVNEIAKIARGVGQYQFFNPAQLAVAGKAREILPPKTVVLTASNHNHWLPALTGRTIVMGYPGWLWTYGIDYSSRQADVAKMYQGNAELLNQYQVDYVVIGPDERQMWPDLNEAYFRANFPLVLGDGQYDIFKIK